MSNFENINFRSFDEAFDAKPNVKVVVGSGKGGVGKTTTNAGVLLALERKGVHTFGNDLDGSPSLELLTAAKRPDGQESHLINPVAVSRIDGYEIPIAQTSVVIPELEGSIFAKVEELLQIAGTATRKAVRQKAIRDAENIIKVEYKRLADALLPSSLDSRQTYLPLLRPALQPVAWNIGVDMKDLATAIQLIEMIANKRHLIFDLTHGSESVRTKITPVQRADVILLDTENANHLINLLMIVRKFRIFLGTVSAASGNLSSKAVSMILSHSGEGDIFADFFKNELRQNPDAFFAGAKNVTDMLMGDEMFLVQTVNPATAVTEQTLADIRRLLGDGICPDFIAMTRWPSEGIGEREAKEVEGDFLTKLDTLLKKFKRKTSYKRLGEKGIEPRAIPESPGYEETQHQNMRIMADALTS